MKPTKTDLFIKSLDYIGSPAGELLQEMLAYIHELESAIIADEQKENDD